MFQTFSNAFTHDHRKFQDDNLFYKDVPRDLFELINLFSGVSFNHGLYRIHSFRSSSRWATIIGNYFKNYNHIIFPFSFDWTGRQYCLSKLNNKLLFMFDPSTGDDFTLEQDIVSFHNIDLVSDTLSILSSDIFENILAWHKYNSIGYNEILGYKMPLFLGGADSIDNYQKFDMEVYWEIYGQLYIQTKGMSDGTVIDSIKIIDPKNPDEA